LHVVVIISVMTMSEMMQTPSYHRTPPTSPMTFQTLT
jgi:hypothetical protein